MLNQRIFNNINNKRCPLELDLFADCLNTKLPQYMSWRPEVLSMGTNAFQIKKVCIPPFCLITRSLAKLLKGIDCYNISSMANSAILYYLMLLSLYIDNQILLLQLRDMLLPSKCQMHPLIRTNILTLVA